MHVLLVPVGSSGDVHPFIAMGCALRDRGHQVTMIVHAHFEPLVRRVGLPCRAVGEAEQYDAAASDPDLWHPRKGLEVVARLGAEMIRPVYDLVNELLPAAGQTVIVAAGLAFGARIAAEKHGFSLATVHLQPNCLWSAYEAPAFPHLTMPRWWPPPVKRLMYRIADWTADRVFGPAINSFRSELGLPPARRLLHEWWHSPDLILGLFPSWYAPPQPDWPPPTQLTGFPLYDEGDVAAMPADAEQFLRDGERPIVCTPGSANQHGQQFFEAIAWACQRLGRRGILLTRYPKQIPKQLPPGVVHFDYIPFSRLLPRAAALVHHGGIGTMAQGMAAGLPQLLMPMGFDQPDNAARIRRLGIGTSIKPKSFRGPRVARALAKLLASKEVAERAQSVAGKIHGASPLDQTCEAIEELAGRVSSSRAQTHHHR